MSINLVDTNINQDFTPVLDYVPVISTARALKSIFDKMVYLPKMSSDEIEKSRYYTYLNTTSYTRQLFLLLPIIGNSIVYLSDCSYEDKQEDSKALGSQATANNILEKANQFKSNEVQSLQNQPISSAEIKEVFFDGSTPFKYNWTGDENYLFLDFNFLKGIEMSQEFEKKKDVSSNPEKYFVRSIFKPAKNYKLISRENGELQDIEIIVELTNGLNKKSLEAVMSIKSRFITNNNYKSSFSTSTTRSSITNPPIDWNKGVDLKINREKNYAYFVFANSFPFSKM